MKESNIKENGILPFAYEIFLDDLDPKYVLAVLDVPEVVRT